MAITIKLGALALLFLLILITPTISTAVEWDWRAVPADNENQREVFYDAHSIRKLSKGIIRVWAKYTAERTELRAGSNVGYCYTAFLSELDCPGSRKRQLRQQYYNCADQVIYEEDYLSLANIGVKWANSYIDWTTDYNKGSIVDRLIRYVCDEVEKGGHLRKPIVTEPETSKVVRKNISSKKLIARLGRKDRFKQGQIVHIYTSETYIGSAEICSVYDDEVYIGPVGEDLYDSVLKGYTVSPLPPNEYFENIKQK